MSAELVPASAVRPPATGPAVLEPRGRLGSYAGLVSRAMALWIDALIVMLLVTITSYVVRSIFQILGIETNLEDLERALLVTVEAGAVAFVYYTAGFTFFGRTVGKLILGLRVVRPDGRNPNVWRAGVRTFGYVISSILFLGFFWAAVDRRHQAWHDKMAGTFVVYAWDAKRADVLVPHVDHPLVPGDAPPSSS